MKVFRSIIAVVMVFMAASFQSNAQSLLEAARKKAEKATNKIAEKAAAAIVGKTVEKVVDKTAEMAVDKVTEKVTEKVENSELGNKIKSVKTSLDAAMDASRALEGEDGYSSYNSREVLQPRRSSTFSWNGAITLSSATNPAQLMAEFPAVPTAAQIANPVEADQINFYKALKAVTLRAEALNESTTCADEVSEAWRKKFEKTIQDAFGLSAEDMALMNSGNMSPEDEKRIQEKMSMAMFGMTNVEDKMDEMFSDSKEDMLDNTFKEVFAVYDKNDANLKKYYNSSAKEQKEIMSLTIKDPKAGEKASSDFEKRSKAFMKEQSAKDPSFEKEAKAFSTKFSAEIMSAMKSQSSPLLGMANSMKDLDKKMAPIKEMQQKLAKYHMDIMAAFPESSFDNEVDGAFAAAEAKKIEEIKKKIYGSDKTSKEWDAHFQQVEQLIKTYRERAAKVWAADVQKRFDAVKGYIAKVIEINQQAVAEEIIPECAIYRVPLNAVINAGDILAEAYSHFPCNYPAMYEETLAKTVTLGDTPKLDGAVKGFADGGSSAALPVSDFWYPEFYVSSSLADVLEGKHLVKRVYDGSTTQYFRLGAGNSWAADSSFNPKNQEQNKSVVSSAKWTSEDGKRTVVYNADGGFLQLPEGDIVYPLALEKVADGVVWAVQEVDEKGNINIYRCFYKI